ncbi:MAG: glycoside hydrolase family 2 TIM barrel-domain containing protein [Mucinivorans sp.]
MKYNYLFPIITLTFAALASVAQTVAQNSPYTISENAMPVSSVFTTYRSTQAAMRNISQESENYTSLDGAWSVKYLAPGVKPSSSDLDRYADLASWDTISLPKAWQMAGQGPAIYSDGAYPFLTAEPKIGRNTIRINGSQSAIFARQITVPFDYIDKVIYINLQGAMARTTLYVNGQKVGMNTAARTATEFDITKFVERGVNRIAIVVDQYAESSLVEDWAQWRLSGINRGVYMLAQPKIRMRDYLVSTRLDPSYTNGLLETSLLVKSELLNPHVVTVFYDLYDPNGKIISQASREVNIGLRGEDTVRFTATIMGVEKWTAETPTLYTLLYRIKREGRFTETIARKVGFRTVEVKDNNLLINGMREQIRGVNLAEFSSTTGNVLSPGETLAELLKMKRLGINAIRTAGYPLPSFVYEMTDSLGFYVVSTASIDASGMPSDTRLGGTLANDPQWRDVFVDRAVAVYELGKNSPSIIAFATGQNAGNGYCMYQAYLAIKKRDPGRVVIYDGAHAQWNTDIVCPRYISIEELGKLKEDNILQPIIPSCVKFDPRYWQLDNTQGAFIDRWQEPSIIAGGVRFAELTPQYQLKQKPSGKMSLSSAQDDLRAIEKIFAPLSVERGSRANTYVIKNRMQHADLSYFPITYLVKNALGKQQWIRLETVNCAPGQSVTIDLTGRPLQLKIGNIYNSTL